MSKEAEIKQLKIIKHLTFIVDDLDHPLIQDADIQYARSLVSKSLKRHLLEKHMANHRKTIGKDGI